MDEKLKKTINDHYQKGEGSIQDIARTYRLSVNEVLNAIGESELMTVKTTGDLVDQAEAGTNVVLNGGEEFNATFTTD